MIATRARRWSTAALACGLALACARPAAAQSADELARARSEFHEALALETAGDWGGALQKLRAVASVKMTPQVRFNIAVCEEHLGRLVAALGDFRIVRAEAEAAGTAEVAERAAEHLAQLESRVPKLIVRRAPEAEAAVVSVDGVALGEPSLGVAHPVDPGAHVVAARVGDATWFEKRVQLADGETAEVLVTRESAPAPEAVAPAAGAAPSAAATHEAPPRARPRTAGWVALGAGGASLVAGGVLLALRAGTLSDLDAACVDSRCPPSAQSTADRGRLYTGLAEVTIAAGVAGVATGAWLLLRPPPSRPGVGLAAVAPGAEAGASVVGRF